jgi:bifunctional UDP-N-acetylglucosamine pyrophosphorylase/glucosamine-1-phosphate N-acetyltransferase
MKAMDSSLTIVILAAGLGTRMKSKKAKVLHQAGGLTLVENVVLSALSAAPKDRIFVVTGHQAEEVEKVLAPYGVGHFRQTEQKGTGHALRMGEPLLRESTLRALLARHDETGAQATVITTLLDDPSGYGRIVLDEQGHIAAIVEHKAAAPEQLKIREINSGIYCFDAGPLWAHIGEITTDNPAGEYYLTDMIEILRRHGGKAVPLRVEDPSELLGINSRVELAVVDRILRERKARELMLDGVTIEKPETVTIDRQVKIGRDSIIGPFSQILGETAIGEDCRIGAGVIIENSRLEDGVTVKAYSYIGTSTVEAGAQIGPFARLRQDNYVGAGAHIGNFVELKKTRMGAKAKANHLAYLGDSTVGEGSNIGAGTITCNYDGVNKHQTTIGVKAFIGSNATLVAPVTVGDGGYVAAGSVITHEVPPDALAFGRARQQNKPDYALKLRKKP